MFLGTLRQAGSAARSWSFGRGRPSAHGWPGLAGGTALAVLLSVHAVGPGVTGESLRSLLHPGGVTVDDLQPRDRLEVPEARAVGWSLPLPPSTRDLRGMSSRGDGRPELPGSAPSASPSPPERGSLILTASVTPSLPLIQTPTAEPAFVPMTTADQLAPGAELRSESGAAAPASSATPATPASSTSTTVLQPPPPLGAPTPIPGQPLVPTHILEFAALQYQGYPYRFGGATPEGFDCSGLIYFLFKQGGSTIARDMPAQYEAGPHPAKADLQPGDLLFFQNTYMEGLSHNGIYLGNQQFIHAVDETTGVAISNLETDYWTSHWYGATHVR
jgi:cell wall-associated NlpC family hydrolase